MIYILPYKTKNLGLTEIFWWEEMDSNHRRRSRRIYSPLHLAALQSSQDHIELTKKKIQVCGASNRNRTSDTRIFSPLLYRLSYRGKMATQKRLELSTSSVTGWRSNQLSYRAIFACDILISNYSHYST